MRIIILNGSPRTNGSTAKILHAFEKELKSFNNMEVKYVNISDLKINSCKGCCYCYKEGNCFIKDDAEQLSKDIERADGLIIGSPTYASNISGQLKEFVDRGHFVIEQLLYGKYAVSVVTGENYGSKDTNKILCKLLKYSGAKISGNIRCDLPFNNNPLDNEKIQNKIHKIAVKFNKDINVKRKYIIQDMFHKIIFNIGIKPFVFKKEKDYEGVLKHWKQNGIINC